MLVHESIKNLNERIGRRMLVLSSAYHQMFPPDCVQRNMRMANLAAELN